MYILICINKNNPQNTTLESLPLCLRRKPLNPINRQCQTKTPGSAKTVMRPASGSKLTPFSEGGGTRFASASHFTLTMPQYMLESNNMCFILPIRIDPVTDGQVMHAE